MTLSCNTSWRLPTAGPLIIGGDITPCPDAEAVLKNSNGDILSITLIGSGETEDILAPDATVLVNGDGSFPTIKSGGLENIGVENTLGAPVGAFDTNTNSWVIPDSNLQVNGTAFGSVPSGGGVDVLLRDEADNPINPKSLAFPKIVLEQSFGDPFWQIVQDLVLTGNYNSLNTPQ